MKKVIFLFVLIVVVLCIPIEANANTENNTGVNFGGQNYSFHREGDGSISYTINGGASQRIKDTRPRSIYTQYSPIDPKTDIALAAEVIDGKIFVIYKGRNDTKIYFSTFDGNKWTGDISVQQATNGLLDPRTDGGIGATLYKGKLYIAYKGNKDKKIFYLTFDGNKWDKDKSITQDSNGKVDPWTDNRPVLFIGNSPDQKFKGVLVIRYFGYNTKTTYETYFDGTNWLGEKRI